MTDQTTAGFMLALSLSLTLSTTRWCQHSPRGNLALGAATVIGLLWGVLGLFSYGLQSRWWLTAGSAALALANLRWLYVMLRCSFVVKQGKLHVAGSIAGALPVEVAATRQD